MTTATTTPTPSPSSRPSQAQTSVPEVTKGSGLSEKLGPCLDLIVTVSEGKEAVAAMPGYGAATLAIHSLFRTFCPSAAAPAEAATPRPTASAEPLTPDPSGGASPNSTIYHGVAAAIGSVMSLLGLGMADRCLNSFSSVRQIAAGLLPGRKYKLLKWIINLFRQKNVKCFKYSKTLHS